MADDVTNKHLSRARVRGAPARIPGAAGLVGSYRFEEVQRQAMRALTTPLAVAPDSDGEPSLAEIRAAQAKLARVAATQSLSVLEPPVLVLKADPMEQVPHEWQWELCLPVRGKLRADEAAGVHAGRLVGGAYLATMTTRGLPDLPNVYTFFLGSFMPARHQELPRPLIYHRIVSGIESADPAELAIEVFLPFAMTLKDPLRLVTREEL